MKLILALLAIFHQSTNFSEQAVLDHFTSDFYLNRGLFENPCEEDDPDCLFIPPLIDARFLMSPFLEGFQVYVDPIVTDNLHKNPTYIDAPIMSQVYGKRIFEGMQRILKKSQIADNYNSTDPTTPLKVPIIFTETSIKTFRELQDLDDWMYIKISKAIDTGMEYYVQLSITTNSSTSQDTTITFEFILDRNSNLLDWQI